MLSLTNLPLNRSRSLSIALAGVLMVAPAIAARHAVAQQQQSDGMPIFKEYRGVQLGMQADEARKKLGNSTNKADDQEFFIFNDKETVQLIYDKDHKVVTISVDFQSGAKDIPTPKVMFGSDIATKTDGSQYRMVRYPKAGCWVSFSKTAGDSPLTSIVLNRIEF